MYIVYKTTCLKDDSIYIGFHKTDKVEFDGYFGSGTILTNKLKKYGSEFFIRETLFTFDNAEDALRKEKELVTPSFVLQDNVMNLVEGGGGCILFGEQNGFFGKTHSQETKDHLSAIRTGSEMSEEIKLKIKTTLTEKMKDPEFKKRFITGRSHDPLVGRKISDSLKLKYQNGYRGSLGYKHSDESKARMKENSNRGSDHYKFKGFYVTPFGKFETFMGASKTIELDRDSVLDRCKFRNDCIVKRVCKFVTKSDIGKTWKELGWGFEQV